MTNLGYLLYKLSEEYRQFPFTCSFKERNLRNELHCAINYLTPYLIYKKGKSASGSDFTSGKNLPPKSIKLKNLLSYPEYDIVYLGLPSRPKQRIQINGQYHYLTKKSDNELFKILYNTLKKGIWRDTQGEETAHKIVKHLRTGQGKDFDDSFHLSNLMLRQNTFIENAKKIRSQFSSSMRNSNVCGDFSQVKLLGIEKPNFGGFQGYLNDDTLATLVGGTQEIIVLLNDIQYYFPGGNYSTSNLFSTQNFFVANLNIVLYDDFGINESDITSDSFASEMAKEALISHWILNNQRGYKPFRTKFIFKTTVNGTF